MTGFAIDAGKPLPPKKPATSKIEEVRNLEWFKKQLGEQSVSPMHIHMNAGEQFGEIEEHLFDIYLPLRRNYSHRDALLRAKDEYKKAEEKE